MDNNLYSSPWFTDYAIDIELALRERETQLLPFYIQSPQLDYRQCLVEMICSISEAEKLSRTTVHLSVYLLDIFMDNHNIFAERLKLVALVCLILASKIEERESKVLKISEVNEMVRNQYPISDYRYLEQLILRFMNWNLLVPTAAQFVEFYLIAIISDVDFQSMTIVDEKIYEAMMLVSEFLDFVLQDFLLMHKTPSKVAAACVAATRIHMELEIPWSEQLVKLTSYQLSDLDCIVQMLTEHKEGIIYKMGKNKKRKIIDSGYLSEDNDV